MRLQYQMSSGRWVDCGERTEFFFDLILKNNGVDADGKICPMCAAIRPLTIAEAESALANGMTLRNDPADWYSKCRMMPENEPQIINPGKSPVMIICKKCGCRGYRGAYPFSTGYAGNICDDCGA